MATAASVIMDRAETILQDTSNARWTEAELLDWLNEAQGVIVQVKPDSNAVIEAVLMSSGGIQSLPSTAIQLLDATYNMGTDDGTDYGNAITIVDRAMMDACYPGWQTATAATVVKHVIYDPIKLPKKYWIYPQSDGTNYIQIITAKIPSDVAAKANDIQLADEYVPAIMEWMLYRALSKDAEYVATADSALVHLEGFQSLLGIREKSETQFAPRRDAGGLA